VPAGKFAAAAAASLIAGLILGPVAHAADVAGRVLGPTGKPAAGARVYIEGLLKGAVTDADGRYRLTDVAPGDRVLVVEGFALARSRTPLVLRDDRPATLNVTLAPNAALTEAARRYIEPQPERLAHKAAYLQSLRPTGRKMPNILVILFDDLGLGDLGSYGNRLIRTPHMDSIAKAGVRLTEFYAASPVCTPSRAALLTGRYPNRALAANHVFFPDKSPGHTLRSAAGFPNALMRDEILLPEMLGRLGYRTVMAGKWHLGDRPGHVPNDLGFERFHGIHFSNDMQPLSFYRDRSVTISAADLRQDQLTQLITDAAVAEIGAADARPFFLYVPFTAPHVPHAIAPPHANKSDAGLYGDVVEEADAAVGRIRAALRAAGRDRDTLIVITSDNGGDRRGSSGGYRGMKQQTFEGGMRVPMIASWPGHLPRGKVRGGMSMIFDLLPTFLAIGGAPLPQDRLIDGRDVMGLLTGRASSPHGTLFYLNGWSGRAEAVRDARFKYRAAAFEQVFLPFYPGDFGIPVTEPAMLTDLMLDREAHDLSARRPGEAQRLSAALARFNAEAEANPRGWR
jgi:arylsulfatase A-like enzyme